MMLNKRSELKFSPTLRLLSHRFHWERHGHIYSSELCDKQEIDQDRQACVAVNLRGCNFKLHSIHEMILRGDKIVQDLKVHGIKYKKK